VLSTSTFELMNYMHDRLISNYDLRYTHKIMLIFRDPDIIQSPILKEFAVQAEVLVMVVERSLKCCSNFNKILIT
jgi:hypothetical protein